MVPLLVLLVEILAPDAISLPPHHAIVNNIGDGVTRNLEEALPSQLSRGSIATFAEELESVSPIETFDC